MPWQQVTVIADQQIAPQIAELFSNTGAVSVTYMDAEDQPVYEPPPGETKIWRNTQVIALFEMDIECVLVKHILSAQFPAESASWQIEILQDQQWERSWMKHFKPTKFGQRLWVCPSGQRIEDQDTTIMTLDPGLAFGTGTHPTTALCLSWLADNNVHNKTIVDYGCGSGILGIAGVLLGARSADCVDIDPQALEATQINAEKNQVCEHIHRYLPEQFKPSPFDIVIANILALPLIELAEPISHLLSPNGKLILSGILLEQADSVMTAYQQQQICFAPLQKQEEWCMLEGSYCGETT